jgi:hypothetical protein
MPMIRNDNELARRFGWSGFLIIATVMGSFVFSCATPFAALGALAALFLPRRDAVAVIAGTWAVNQIIGFGFLHYPLDATTIAWGGAIGAAAIVGTGAAMLTVRALSRMPWSVAAIAALATAFVGYELALFAADFVLPSSPSDYGVPVLLYVFEINGFAFAGLLVLQALGRTLGLASPRLTTASAAI